jgi:putative acetyltransferase
MQRDSYQDFSRDSYRDSYKDFLIRAWQPGDRAGAAEVIAQVLMECGLATDGLAVEPGGADWDVLHVETAYWQQGGEFWVVEQQGRLVGTAGYYPIRRGQSAVEIRKMYLRPEVRGLGLGRYLLETLEQAIRQQGFQQIWVETASVLEAAVQLYESSGYQPGQGVETTRCDRVYYKQLRT